MSLPLIPMTDRELALSEARAAVSRPLLHATHDLRAACAVLLAEGDWIDAARARELARRLGQEEAEAEELRRRAAEARAREAQEELEARLHVEAARRMGEARPRALGELVADWVGGLALIIAFGGVLVLGWGLS